MQKIVLFIEPAWRASATPTKIGNLFMNRFGIDEDAKHEILKIYHLENRIKPSAFRNILLEAGIDLINKGIIVHD